MFMRISWLMLFLLPAGRMAAQNTEVVYKLKDRFVSSVGLQYSIANHNHIDAPFYGACYSPALNLLNKYSDFSVAFASHISAGYHPGNATGSAVAYSFPAFLQFNFGHMATHNFYSSFGFFFGGGYNFGSTGSGFDAGPLLITAIRFWFLRHSFTLGYAQTHFQNSTTLMHEISLQLNVGAYLRDTRNNNKISKFVKPFRK